MFYDLRELASGVVGVSQKRVRMIESRITLQETTNYQNGIRISVCDMKYRITNVRYIFLLTWLDVTNCWLRVFVRNETSGSMNRTLTVSPGDNWPRYNGRTFLGTI